LKKSDIIRAWKDPEYRSSLLNAPASPAGIVELDDVALEGLAAAARIGEGLFEVEAPSFSLTNSTGCTVSGMWRLSCGEVCTSTTECFC
jgi:mersacidin/lichenicidin family type 2 lantibiotic